MEQHDFDELVNGARQLAQHFPRVYRDVTGEDLDLEGIIRHYPLVAMGVVAGLGAVGGWIAARRTQKALPPPPTETPNPLQFVERLLPDGMEKVRDLLPEGLAEDAATTARAWVDEVLEPKLKEGMEAVVANVGETRFGLFVRQTLQRLDSGEDKHLDDPEGPPPHPPA